MLQRNWWRKHKERPTLEKLEKATCRGACSAETEGENVNELTVWRGLIRRDWSRMCDCLGMLCFLTFVVETIIYLIAKAKTFNVIILPLLAIRIIFDARFYCQILIIFILNHYIPAERDCFPDPYSPYRGLCVPDLLWVVA